MLIVLNLFSLRTELIHYFTNSFWRFTSNRRRDLLFAWLTLFPNMGFFPVTSHTLLITSSLLYPDYISLTKKVGEFTLYSFRCKWKGYIPARVLCVL